MGLEIKSSDATRAVKTAIGNRGFGRRRRVPDLRDHLHLARTRLMQDAIPLRTTGRWHWKTGPVLDQGDNPHCVAYAFKSLLEASPVRQEGTLTAVQLYKRAQELDEWPGTDYEGTSVRGGAKAVQEEGALPEYLWSFDVPTTTVWVLNKSPVVIGIVWPDSMMDPYKDDFLKVEGDLVNAGGHSVIFTGVDTEIRCPDDSRGAYRIQCAWTRKWANNGRAWLPFNGAKILFAEAGEVCMPTEARIAGRSNEA
jgi:hypothetical protein